MEYSDFIILANYNTNYGNLKVEKNKLYLYERESSAEDYGNNILDFLLKIVPSISLQDYKEIKERTFHNTEQTQDDPYHETTYFEETLNLKTVYDILMKKNLLNSYDHIEQAKDGCDKESFFQMLYTMALAYPEDLKINDDCLYISKHALYLKQSSEDERNIKDMFNIAFDFNGINDRFQKFNSFLVFYKSIYDEDTIGRLSEASEECKEDKNFNKIDLNNLYACFLSTREYKPELILEKENNNSFKI